MTHSTLRTELDESRRRSFEGMDVPWMLEQWDRRTPEATALVWEPFTGAGGTWTYRQLRSAARRFAGGLHKRGVRAGDFVIIHLDSSPEFIIAWYGCAELGAVAVSTNTRSVARDLSYFAAHTSAVAAITSPGFLDLVVGSCPDLDLVVVTADDAGG